MLLLTQKALKKSRLLNRLERVTDGQELLDYLKKRGKYDCGDNCPRPGVILLDLNMPRMDGRQALKEIKEDESLKDIPIVVFTTSKAEEDIYKTYKLGVNSFITKPVTFENLMKVMEALGTYWFKIVELPKEANKNNYV